MLLDAPLGELLKSAFTDSEASVGREKVKHILFISLLLLSFELYSCNYSFCFDGKAKDLLYKFVCKAKLAPKAS